MSLKLNKETQALLELTKRFDAILSDKKSRDDFNMDFVSREIHKIVVREEMNISNFYRLKNYFLEVYFDKRGSIK